MEPVSFPKNLNDVEKHIDRTLSNLRIHKFPLHLALMASLTLFEIKSQRDLEKVGQSLSAEFSIVYCKAGLQILIPQLFARCPQLELDSNLIEITPDVLTAAADALEFCQRYHKASLCFTHFHGGRFAGSIEDRVVTFTYPEGIDFGYAQLDLALHRYRDYRTPVKSLESGKLPLTFSLDSFNETVREAIQEKRGNILFESIPDEVYFKVRKMTDAWVSGPTIDTTAQCTYYTLDEYYRLWLELVTLIAAYSFLCQERSNMDSALNPLENRLVFISLPHLARTLTKHTNIAHQLVTEILSDLVLNLNTSNPDVLIQPLVPLLGTNGVIITPSLLTTSNWEVCLLRNWRIRYPKIYRSVIGQKKKGLDDQFAEVFTTGRFMVSAHKPLKDRQGQEIGDVDTAIFDPAVGLLALFQLKWPIEPDSPRERINANKDILKGIEQARRNKLEFERDNISFLKQVFPNSIVKPEQVKNVRYFVIGYGYIGSGIQQKDDIPIIDYTLICDIAREHPNASLDKILTLVLNQQKALSEASNRIACTIQIKLAHFLFRMPGMRDNKVSSIMTSKSKNLKRNDHCLCGSGMKYRKCCLEVKNYTEDLMVEG